MKILITGFDPFGGATINPAFEAVKRLPHEIHGAEIIKLEIPTVFEKEGEVLRDGIMKHQPDVTICIGQAGGRSGITVEKIAINLMEARIKDNEGQQPIGKPIYEDGENAYFATVPVKAMVKNIKENGIPSSVSYTAGTFVCNDVMYRLLHMIKHEYPHMRGGFIHVPYLTEQVVDLPAGTPSMSVDTITEALEYAIISVIENKTDATVTAGTIM